MSAQNPNASSIDTAPAGSHAREVAAAAAVAAAGAALLVASAIRAGAGAPETAAALLAFAVVFAPCPVLAVTRWSFRLRAWLARAPAGRAALIVILAVAALAVHAALLRQYGPRALGWLTPHAALHVVAVELALALVVIVAPAESFGFTFALDRRELVPAVLAFAAFAAAGIPIGIASGFIHFGWRGVDALAVAALAYRIYFTFAIPEELLFRGVVQNALEGRLFGGRRWPWSLALASLTFGAAHLGHRPAPNWRYGLLAALAGVAYGWVWRRTRKITASALTHALVDLAWVLGFGGR